MKAKINIEVSEIADTGMFRIIVEAEGQNKAIIEGLVEALAQAELGDNEQETTMLRLYIAYRLECIRKEYDNEN